MIKSNTKKEVMRMPTLKHLLEELKLLRVKPDEVRVPRRFYDRVVDQAEEVSEEHEE